MAQSSPGPGGSTRGAVLTGIVVGVIVFALGATGVYVVRHTSLHKGDTHTTAPHSSASSTPNTASATPSPTPTAALPATDPRLKSFYTQKIDWHGCGGNQCGTLRVPLDYADPGARSISLAVLKVPASDQGNKAGALVVNPGGPGGSGIQYAAAGALQFGENLHRHYDIVGFDPRGVGSSTPLQCVGTRQLDAVVGYDPDPDNAAERHQLDALVHAFGEGCLRHDAALARHISTPEAARDIDILRAALGQPKLDYFGASYGTFLGATYADLFPTHVGRMVLDGALDPSLSNEQLSLQQGHGFEVALRSYVQDCVRQGNCFLGDTVTAGTRRIRRLLDRIEAHPLPTDTDRKLTVGLATIGIWMPLYVKSYWPQLSDGLRQAMGGSGSKLLSLADLYASRGPDGYLDNSFNALYDINCLDHDDYIPTSQVPAHFAQFLKASPTFGKAFAFSLSTCSAWPIKTHRRTTALHAKGAPPIVVIGTTRDPATPLAWAKALARQLDSGVLVTRNGDGHTAFHQGNSCIDGTVEDYLIEGTVPQNGKAC